MVAYALQATNNSWVGSIGSQVLNPIHVSKFQHEDKIPTFQPQETINIWSIIDKVECRLI